MISDELRNKWKRKLNTIKEAIDDNKLNLNDWELSFIDSIDTQLSNEKDLTIKQSSVLYRIYDKII